MGFTYILLNNNDILRSVLNKHGFTEIKYPYSTNIVDYIHVTQNDQKNIYQINCTLKNIITNDKLKFISKTETNKKLITRYWLVSTIHYYNLWQDQDQEIKKDKENQILQLTDNLYKKYISYIKPFIESTYAYEVFCLKFDVDQDIVNLVEITLNNEDNIINKKSYYEWIYDNIIKWCIVKKILIIKPIASASGVGIEVVTNNKELQVAKINIKKDFKYGAIASEYIINPMLWNNKKFHVRMYWLVTSSKKYYLWNRGKIITARDDYINKDHSNKNIHDTHMGSTPTDLWFPNDLPKGANVKLIYEQFNEVTDYIGRMFITKMETYPESKYSFDVFGIDFLITNNNKVYLLEINGHNVSYSPATTDFSLIDGPWTDDFSKFSREYYEWLYKHAIEPYENEYKNKNYIFSGYNGLDYREFHKLLQKKDGRKPKII